ncbi:nucleotidyltransferase family protein [Rhabdothermincola salaria]|uniref:nucleotidyltransferase family protein n=1 Tax=Rhabdothermincola salaria TaxID=2903142 RepID=UPI001E39B735|nr:nucleotidyltransferase family protein [Rhabdothermincola salaria]MCD9623474.1 nucleotidyltransferase family protein [Rhabdothermincola salaria]
MADVDAPLVAAAVLAAGGSSRFEGGPKQLATLRGRALVTHAVEAAVGAEVFAAVFVVTGAADLTGALPGGVVVLDNPRWAEGQATSLAVAVHAATVGGFDALVVGLADQPFVGADAWRLVATEDVGRPIAAATYGGQRGNPVRLDREVWPLLAQTGDEGARTLMRGRPELVGEVACPGDALDIDTVEDLDRWS